MEAGQSGAQTGVSTDGLKCLSAPRAASLFQFSPGKLSHLPAQVPTGNPTPHRSGVALFALWGTGFHLS